MAPLRERDRELTDEEIAEMLRSPGAEVRDWALENPDPALRLDEAPGIYSGDLGQRMPSPEFQHEAKKDFLKAAATEVAGSAALGGAGALAKAGFGWLPLNMETVKTIRKLLGSTKHRKIGKSQIPLSTADTVKLDTAMAGEAGDELKELWLKHAPSHEPRQVAIGPKKEFMSHYPDLPYKGEFGPHTIRESVSPHVPPYKQYQGNDTSGRLFTGDNWSGPDSFPSSPRIDAVEMKGILRQNLYKAGVDVDKLRDLSDEEFLRVLKEQRVADPEGFPMSNLDAFKKALGGQ